MLGQWGDHRACVVCKGERREGGSVQEVNCSVLSAALRACDVAPGAFCLSSRVSYTRLPARR